MKNIYLLFACFYLLSCKSHEYSRISGFAQGTTYSIIYENSTGKDYSEAIDSLLKVFDMSLSEYQPQSVISQINANNPEVEADKYFKAVFEKSKEIWEESDGYMDITVGPIVNALGFGPKEKTVVDTLKIKELLRFVGFDKVKMEGNRVIKADTAVKLDVNSIAQGYSVDVVCDYLEEEGIDNFLVEIGGEIRTKGKNPEKKVWRIGIDKPEEGLAPGEELQEVVTLRNRALSTAGNYRKYFEENGVKYTHIINPKTGLPAKSQLLSVTIVAKDCITADGWDTPLMAMGLEKSKEILQKHPEIEAYLLYSDNTGKIQVYMTDGFKAMIEK